MDRLDQDELLYLRVMLGLAQTGDMFHGRFVEVHVARLLGADLPTTGTNKWDLLIHGPKPIPVEVKATTLGGSYKIDKTSDAHVWVFVAFTDKRVRPRHYSYAVVPGSDVTRLKKKQKSIAQAKLFSAYPPVTQAKKLIDAVRQADAVHLSARR